mmetsp:Transcript_30397/g.70049  ORF Transcript_30397/g.70049 Transcript_30397/m.70049 type:complete len:247 (-) Transcript_30397:149-889(-)
MELMATQLERLERNVDKELHKLVNTLGHSTEPLESIEKRIASQRSESLRQRVEYSEELVALANATPWPMVEYHVWNGITGLSLSALTSDAMDLVMEHNSVGLETLLRVPLEDGMVPKSHVRIEGLVEGKDPVVGAFFAGMLGGNPDTCSLAIEGVGVPELLGQLSERVPYAERASRDLVAAMPFVEHAKATLAEEERLLLLSLQTSCASLEVSIHRESGKRERVQINGVQVERTCSLVNLCRVPKK